MTKPTTQVIDLFGALRKSLEPVIRVEPGDTVLCDYCNEDYTKSSTSGGLLFQSKAACPSCAPRIQREAEGHGETNFIRARCPEGKSFADWVREDLRP